VEHILYLQVKDDFTLKCFFLYSETRNSLYITFNVYEHDILDIFQFEKIHLFFEEVIHIIKNKKNNFILVLCGHSLGSSLCLYLNYLLKKEQSNKINNEIIVLCSGQYKWIPPSNHELVLFYSREHENVYIFITCQHIYNSMKNIDRYITLQPINTSGEYSLYPFLFYIVATIEDFLPSDTIGIGGHNQKIIIYDAFPQKNYFKNVEFNYIDKLHQFILYRAFLRDYQIQKNYYSQNGFGNFIESYRYF